MQGTYLDLLSRLLFEVQSLIQMARLLECQLQIKGAEEPCKVIILCSLIEIANLLLIIGKICKLAFLHGLSVASFFGGTELICYGFFSNSHMLFQCRYCLA